MTAMTVARHAWTCPAGHSIGFEIGQPMPDRVFRSLVAGCQSCGQAVRYSAPNRHDDEGFSIAERGQR